MTDRLSRRDVLSGVGGITILGSLAGCSGDGGGANGDASPTTGGGSSPTGTSGPGGAEAVRSYLQDANGFESIEDATGQNEVSVEVGAGNGLAYAPAAVRVSTGTTVNWTWTGQGGAHNVVSESDSVFEFDSGDAVTDGSFSYTFEEAGAALYYCTPHRASGMKGAVLVE